MTTLTLPWFPPAPAAGPLSILELPTGEWALEPKIDGIRVIWFEGRAYTRHGMLLSLSKGANKLARLLSGIEETLDGEWVPGEETFVAFDLPDCLLDYDGRREVLSRILGAVPRIETSPNSAACPINLSLATSFSGVRFVTSFDVGNFPKVYADLRSHAAEGVVLKRRGSVYTKQVRSVDNRDWLKRRFNWD